MLRFLTVSLLAFFLASSETFADPIVLTFDELDGSPYPSQGNVPDNRILDDHYLNYGVLFSNTVVVNLDAGPIKPHAPSPKNGIAAFYKEGKNKNVITYDSARPQIAISFVHDGSPGITDFVSVQGDLRADSGEEHTLFAYNIAGDLIASYTHLDEPGHVYSIATPGIHRVVWSGTPNTDQLDYGGVALDNLTFNAVRSFVVPEPSSIMLATFGLIGVFGFQMRRKRPQ